MDYDLAPHEDFDGFQQVRRFQNVSMSLILPASAFCGQTHDGAAHTAGRYSRAQFVHSWNSHIYRARLVFIGFS